MTERKTPDYVVYTVTHLPHRETGKWDDIGVGFTNANSLTVKLRALPVNGELVLMKPRPKDQNVDD